MADVLSQGEVESLLAALDAAPAESSGGYTSQPARNNNESLGQISVYDFKRPERVSKEQMRAFQALHEGFSREFGAAVSGMLRSIIEVKLISVDQLTYGEFVFSLENPTCFNLLYSDKLNGHIILDLNPSIIYPIVDRLLGGGKSATQSFPSRPLTEIELKLVSRITKSAIAALENSWKNISELNLRVSQIESNPQLVQIVPPNEVIVLISFEITMGDLRGIMNLCIPFNTIEPLVGKLSSDTWSAYSKHELTSEEKAQLEVGIGSAEVETVAVLAETTMSTSDLLHLNVGDVILTERDVSEGITLHIEGYPTFTADIGQLKGHKALQIREPLLQVRDIIKKHMDAKSETENPKPKVAAKP
ncbi:flagellar motor switch protein FliM [uncultured Rubinisphaera sp.]|uniref:flagellar motor switch protein FliM n=1 Tax=uncultured Rubinisphaera sp. TaxID=1678686 RepID=UPI0030D8E54C